MAPFIAFELLAGAGQWYFLYCLISFVPPCLKKPYSSKQVRDHGGNGKWDLVIPVTEEAE
jgi:hypothetical protein